MNAMKFKQQMIEEAFTFIAARKALENQDFRYMSRDAAREAVAVYYAKYTRKVLDY